MNAEWNVNVIAEMNAGENLRNTCRQIEQRYVSWRQNATVQGCRIVREWPAIGELGRYRVDGVRICFITTRHRSVEVQDAAGSILGMCAIKVGLAEDLYSIAQALIATQ